MKVKSLLAALIAAVLIPLGMSAQCNPQSLPYAEDFDNLTTLSSCFRTQNATLSSTYSVTQGGKSVMMTTGSTASYIMFPAIAAHANALECTFKMRNATSSASVFYYGAIVADTSDIGSFTPVFSNTISGSNSWEDIEFNTSTYTGTDSPAFFIIYIPDGASANIYVDNINIHAIPLCPRPQNVAVTSTTASDVTFGWTAGGSESQWSLTYSIEQSGTTVASSTVTTSQPTYTVTGLSSSTTYTYTVSLRALCSATDSSAVRTASGSFSTSCVIISTFPYIEDFEGGTFPAACQNTFNPFNDMWAEIGSYSLNTSKYHSSSHSLKASRGNEGSMPSFALPQMNFTDPNGYTVSFWAYRHNDYPNWKTDEGYKIYVSAVNNTLQGATELGFIPAGYTLSPTEAQEGWYQYSFNIPTTFNGLYYVIVTFVNQYHEVGYIDDITVGLAPGCGPITATSENVAYTTADIVASSTSVTDWQIYYAENVATAQFNIANVSGASRYTLTGLTPNTQYVYYVRRICGTDTSTLSSAQLFRTKEMADTLPFYTGFEDSTDDARWTMAIGGGGNFYIGSDAAGVYAGNRAMYVSYDNYTYGYHQSSSTQTYASRLFHFEEGDYTVSFRYKCTGGERSSDSISIFDFGRAFLVPDTTALNGGSEWKAYAAFSWPADLIPLEPSYHAYYCLETGDANGWNLGSYDVHMAGKSGDYKLAFFWNNDGSSGAYYPLAIDELSIRTLTCPRPQPAISMLTSSSANISMSGANSYQLVVSSQMISLNDSVVTGDIMDTIFTTGSVALTGLTANTTYYYTARSFCSASDISEWSEPTEFTTECLANVPYSESFEQAAVLGCWTSMTGNNLARSSQQAHAGINSLYINNDIAVSPEIDVNSMAQYTLNGWVYSAAADVLYVGVIDDPTDPATLDMAIDTISIPAGVWTEFTADFTLLTDPDHSDFYNARHFTLSMQNNTPFYADQLYLATPTVCQRPVDPVITDTVHNGFQMSWTDTIANQWIVRVSDINGGNENKYVVDTPYVNVADLNEQTLYSVEVAAICGAGDTSVYTSCGNVRTPIYVPTCPDPAAAPAVNATTAQTMTVTANGSYTDYEFAYGTSSDITLATVLPVQTAARIVITGLASSSTYNVWFRGVCEPGDTSRWSAMASGTTTYDDFFMPQNVHVVGVASNTTTIAWGGCPDADMYVYELVNNATGAVMTDTVVFTNLTPATNYTFRVCAVDTVAPDSTAWVTFTFKTIATPAQTPYFCDFEDVAENNNWMFENDSQANKFMIGNVTDFGAATNALFVSGDNSTNSYSGTPSTVYATRTLNLNAGMFRYSYNWVCAGEPSVNPGLANDYPRIFLAPASMQFEAGTIANGIGYGFNDVPAGCLVLDSGYHLTQALTTRNVNGVFELQNGGYYNLVVFWTNDNSLQNDPAITVDSIRLAQVINGDHYTDTICYGENYNLHGFNVPSTQLYVGMNNLSRIAMGTTGNPDTLFTATVTMRALISREIYDTICDGESYNKYGFVFTTTPVSGRYSHLNDTSVTGCDSSTYLNLHVVPISTIQKESICKGETYYWHGQAYNTAGTYSYNGQGAHGCQVNDTLVLSIIDGDVTYTAQICNGGSHFFIDTVITTAGTYSRHFFDPGIGCYVTHTVTVSVVTTKTEEYYDIACEGHPYTGYSFNIPAVTKDTTLSKTVPSVDGCDSTTTVHLRYVATVTSEFDDTIPEIGIYYWGGKTLTEPGDYPFIYQSVATGCDSVVTLHLHANPTTGIENVANVRVELVPNPVNAGETAMVYGNFGEVSTVEILNSFGQVVDRFVPTTYPIEVSGISGVGIYYVRVMTSSGNVYVEKLIVK